MGETPSMPVISAVKKIFIFYNYIYNLPRKLNLFFVIIIMLCFSKKGQQTNEMVFEQFILIQKIKLVLVFLFS